VIWLIIVHLALRLLMLLAKLVGWVWMLPIPLREPFAKLYIRLLDLMARLIVYEVDTFNIYSDGLDD